MNIANKGVMQFYGQSKVSGCLIVLHDTPAEKPKTHEYF